MKINTMKTLRLLILLFLIPVTFHAQQKTLTGLWTGALSNDSLTVRNDQSFEIALTEYRGKVYGYSRATFIVNDTLYYILKRVKGTITGDVCEVKDDDIISYNFRGKMDKGVKVTTTFRMNNQDSSWHLDGNWTTNQTKKFYAITGKVGLKDEPDITKSKIFPHLEELNLAKEVPFYVEARKTPEPASHATTIAALTKKNNVVVKKDPVKPKETPVVKTEEPKVNKPTEIAITKPAETKPDRPVETAVAKSDPPKNNKPVETVVTKPEPKKSEPIAVVNPPVEKKNTVTEPVTTVNTTPKEKKQEPVEAVAQVKKQDPPAITVRNEPRKTEAPAAIVPQAAVLVKERKTAAPQEVVFISDSLQLALYDNGEIDGDTVSVLLNGELLLAKQGLKASAIRKTVYIQPGDNEFTLVLYAENLGKYPPNTGLLVIYDGEERYQVRFSADLLQNAAVVFRRKK
jgi:hypothetical protein